MGALRTLHAWAGTALAVLAMVFGLTGTLLVFEDDWIRATVPAAREEVELDPARLGAALNRLDRAEPGLTSVVLPGGAVGAHRLYLAGEGLGYADANGLVVERWQGGARRGPRPGSSTCTTNCWPATPASWSPAAPASPWC